MSKQTPYRTVDSTGTQKILAFVIIIVTFPWSLIYLLVCSSKCAYCGKRILFNKKVCKKCETNAHAIVDNFDEKIDMLYEQLTTADDIYEITKQYGYVMNQFDGLKVIYDALDEQMDPDSLREKTLFTFKRTLEAWMTNQQYQFSINNGYRTETMEEIKDLQEDYPFFTEILEEYLEEISEIVSDDSVLTTQIL